MIVIVFVFFIYKKFVNSNVCYLFCSTTASPQMAQTGPNLSVTVD